MISFIIIVSLLDERRLSAEYHSNRLFGVLRRPLLASIVMFILHVTSDEVTFYIPPDKNWSLA